MRDYDVFDRIVDVAFGTLRHKLCNTQRASNTKGIIMKVLFQALVISTYLSFMYVGNAAFAGIVATSNAGAVTWQAGVDGVEIEWAPDGSLNRIYSRYSTPVEFADRRGIKKAQIIAEEKAKAGIIRFFNQSVSSTRIVSEVQSDINTARQTRSTGNKAHVTKNDERKLIEALTEVTTSFARGNLRGVVVLESGYDKGLEEAWTVVGISKKSIRAAKQAEGFVAGKDSKVQASETDGMSKQGTEVRKNKNKDW